MSLFEREPWEIFVEQLIRKKISGDSSDSVPDSSDQNSDTPGLAELRARNAMVNAGILAYKVAPNSKMAHYLFEKARDKYAGFVDSDTSGTSGSSGIDIGSGSSNPIAEAEDSLLQYFQGLFTNQGKENELNRQFNSAEALKNREFQAQEAQAQRDWYEAMSNSAYTRAVADMKRAGINPILAYSQGGAASSGTGIGAGSAAQYTATGGDTVSSLLSSLADVIYAMSGSSSNKINNAFKLFKMAGSMA